MSLQTVRHFTRRLRGLTRRPPVGRLKFGDLRRVKPVAEGFGFRFGLPIDRYYIERFLATHAHDIRGVVLEVGDDAYTRRFGNHVSRCEVLHIDQGNRKATITADLTKANGIPSDCFDCIILTQTLQYVYDTKNAIRTLHRILKPRGVILGSVPGITQLSRYDVNKWGEYWRFTTLSTRLLFEESFAALDVSVEAHGNVLTCLAFLHGLVSEELHESELLFHDPNYEMLITVRALKAESDST